MDGQHQREAADRAVHYIKGVTGVFNLLTIRPVAVESGVKAAITSAFVRNARIESRHVTVTVDDRGTATLAGTVRSWAESRQAAQACWAAPGVVEVTNNLSIEY